MITRTLIVGCASNVRFEAGTYIFKEGEPANTFYLIRDGKVAVEIFAPQRKPIVVATLGEGEILGWSWLLPPYSGSFTLMPSRTYAPSPSTESVCARSARRTTIWATRC